MYVLDPAVGKPRHIADLDEATGHKGSRAIAQGKSHVNFVEVSGQALLRAPISASTSLVDGRETTGNPPAGYLALPRRPPPRLRPRHRKDREPRHRPRAGGRDHHERRRPAGPRLRPHLAERDLLPSRRGEARDQGPRPVLRAGRGGAGPRLPHDLPVAGRRSRGRVRLLHAGRGDDPPLSLRSRCRRDGAGRRPEEGLLRPLRSRRAGDHGLQLAADGVSGRRPPHLRRARQLRIPLHVRSSRRAHRASGSHHLGALAPGRGVRPVPLRLPRLHPGPGRPHPALPHRRPAPRPRSSRDRPLEHGEGPGEPAPRDLRHRRAEDDRPWARALRRRRPAGQRELDHGRTRRNRLHHRQDSGRKRLARGPHLLQAGGRAPRLAEPSPTRSGTKVQ